MRAPQSESHKHQGQIQKKNVKQTRAVQNGRCHTWRFLSYAILCQQPVPSIVQHSKWMWTPRAPYYILQHTILSLIYILQVVIVPIYCIILGPQKINESENKGCPKILKITCKMCNAFSWYYFSIFRALCACYVQITIIVFGQFSYYVFTISTWKWAFLHSSMQITRTCMRSVRRSKLQLQPSNKM